MYSMQQHAKGMVLNEFGQLSTRSKTAAKCHGNEGQNTYKHACTQDPTLRHQRATSKRT